MCGNGIRCVAKYVYDNKIATGKTITIETLSGVKTVEVHTGIDGLTDTVTVDMGAPIFTPADIPVRYDGDRMMDVAVAVKDTEVRVTAVSVGNPHGVIFVDNFDGDIVTGLGPNWRSTKYGPRKRI